MASEALILLYPRVAELDHWTLRGSFLALDPLWAAAGLPDAVFAIAPGDLVRLSGARPAAVAADP